MKENKTQRAVRQRKEIMEIINLAFLTHEEGEDNSWRCRHNFFTFEGQVEYPLLQYLLKNKLL